MIDRQRPDLEAMLRRGQERFRAAQPGRALAMRRGWRLAVAAVGTLVVLALSLALAYAGEPGSRWLWFDVLGLGP